VRERPGPSYSAEAITSTLWDAGKGIRGVADLRVHMERHGPVRLGEDDVAAAADE